MEITRRKVISLLTALPLLGLFRVSAKPTYLTPTPACVDEDDEPTPASEEGPFFKPRSPQRTNLRESGLPGTLLVLTGRVLNTANQPVAHVLLDWWQADDAGAYDNAGFRLRDHQFTDAQGRFRLETVVPGLYPGRTRHFPVKVQASNKPVLTTQLFFPGEPRNQRDRIFSDALLLKTTPNKAETRAGFTFVLNA